MHETSAQKAGLWIAIIGIIIPSMIVSGFMPKWDVLPLWQWISITSVAGAVGMVIGHKPRLASLLGGAVSGACIPFALIGYVILRSRLSDTYWNVELIIPGLVGALPGLGVFHLIRRLTSHED